jgi:hypothetical protein
LQVRAAAARGGANAIEQIVVDRNGFDAALERAGRDRLL